jgi:hypothetical protein
MILIINGANGGGVFSGFRDGLKKVGLHKRRPIIHLPGTKEIGAKSRPGGLRPASRAASSGGKRCRNWRKAGLIMFTPELAAD